MTIIFAGMVLSVDKHMIINFLSSKMFKLYNLNYLNAESTDTARHVAIKSDRNESAGPGTYFPTGKFLC